MGQLEVYSDINTLKSLPSAETPNSKNANYKMIKNN